MNEARVGDTVTLSDNPAEKPLEGYRRVNPVVFCGIYPADGAKYPDLREALEKLSLNDASLLFEPESSKALGFGFRCGFLGLLHMEIIEERLEREYNLDLVTTAPSVEYKFLLTNGETVTVDNPTNYPDPAVIAEALEPVSYTHLDVYKRQVPYSLIHCKTIRTGIHKGNPLVPHSKQIWVLWLTAV